KIGRYYGCKGPPPKELNLDNNANIYEAWHRWKREFEFFLVTTETDKKADNIKTSTLLTCIGHRSRERFKFFNVKQQENQPIDDFINDLKTKAQECEFKELTESLIRDRIVCGVSNLKLQERLLRESDLTLDRAVLLCKADEDTRKQTDEIQKHTVDSDNKIGAVKVNGKYNRKQNNQTRNNTKYEQRPKSKYFKETKGSKFSKFKPCRYCSKLHDRGQCPAYGKVCTSCGKSNHFAAVCLTSKRVKQCMLKMK
ncbi:Hypothetical predicted protein, partial [Paramuricea clavata]